MNPAAQFAAQSLLAVAAVTLAVYGGYVVDAIDRRLGGHAASIRRVATALAVEVQVGVATAAFLAFVVLIRA